MLKSHREAIERFMENKALGEPGRHRFEDTERKCKEKGAKPLGGDPRTMRSLCSSSEGINPSPTRCIGKAGDNVVVADIEFPSDFLPWTVLEKKKASKCESSGNRTGVSIWRTLKLKWTIAHASFRRVTSAILRAIGCVGGVGVAVGMLQQR